MSIIVKAGGDFKPHEAGAFAAQCIAVIDLGLQVNEWEGEKSIKRQIAIYFDTGEEGSPIVGWYTHSLHKQATLRKHLEGWRGKPFTAEELNGFDLASVAGTQCTITISHTEKGNAKVSMVSKAMKGSSHMSGREMIVVPAGGMGIDRPEYVGEKMWIKMLDGYARLQESEGLADPKVPGAVEQDFDDEIPF